MQRPDHCYSSSPRLARDALVLGPSATLNRDPTSATSVHHTSQTVPQLCVPQQSTTSQPPRLVSRSGQLQEQGFSGEVAERIAAPQRSSTRTIYKSKWAISEKWCRENSVDFSTECYRTAIVDTLGPAGHHISQSSDLNRLLQFSQGLPQKFQESSKMELFCCT